MSLLRADGFLPHMRPLSTKRPSIISVLDIGSSKICCLIARATPRLESRVLPGRTHKIEVLGFGHQRSRGIKSGVVVDLEGAEKAIRLAVDSAERMAGVTVDSLIVSISSGRLVSEAFSADISLGGHAIVDGDIARVLRVGASHALAPERSVVHSIPIGYTLDGENRVRDPRGMMGEKLGVDMHVVTAENAPLRNIELCINRAHLSVEAVVATPYASGLAGLVDDEAEMGCACIDMGGGTTTLSVFMDGRFVHCDAVAVGGQHVTMDMARGLSTRLDDAEKLKILHGSALSGGGSEDDVISVPPIGEDERDVPYHVSRAQLTRIIRPRVEETLELIRDRLNRSGFAGAVGKRIVLTGGASQLTGLSELARRILAKNVRLGRPMGIAGLPEASKGPAFSAGVGLLIYPQMIHLENFASHGLIPARRMTGTGGAFTRLGQWFQESF
ncbi:MAG: cell division protein FtsA [Pseudomonadota bacterium]|nr:cell division protein FtsA [Pseudomonadota bacterium]